MAIIDKRKTYLKEFKALVIDRLRRHHAFEQNTHTHTHTHTHTLHLSTLSVMTWVYDYGLF